MKRKTKKKSVYIIAEAGINHNGNVNIAKEMIEKAANIGANAIKIQSIYPDELFSRTKDPKTYEYAKNFSLSKDAHYELKKHAAKFKIDFFSTVLGDKSLKLLKNLNVKFLKIASMDLSNHELLRKAARTRIPLIISTGMSTFSEIVSAVEVVSNEKTSFSLLHCNSAYPSPIEDANLATIKFLKKIFPVTIGYSDHTLGAEACLIAVGLGATIIEKHFTLNKKMSGPDQKLSADVKEMKNLIKKIRSVEKLLGTPRTDITKSEKKFRALMRRSLHSKVSIQPGKKIKKYMLTAVRPGTGIPPNLIDDIVGLTTSKKIEKGSMITWNMF